MIEDHTLCYGHPWHKICQGCARNITDKISEVDYSVFTILPVAPLNLKEKTCPEYIKQKKRRK